MNNREKLIELYQQMYELTKPECDSVCRSPHSCCSPEYCDIAESWAKERWGIIPDRAINPYRDLKFMSLTGCTLAPHLRPTCTVHTCEIGSLGFKKDDISGKWYKKYWKLRNEIENISYRLFYKQEMESGEAP